MGTRNFESVKDSGEIWNPTKEANGDPRTEATKSDFLDGYYVGKKENVGEHSANLYTIQKDDGEKVNVWGTTALNGEMDKVRLGAYVRIQWLGKKLTKKGEDTPAKQRKSTDSFHAWEVFVDKSAKPLDIQVTPERFSSVADEQVKKGGKKVEEDSSDLPF